MRRAPKRSVKKRRRRPAGEWAVESALQSHWRTETLFCDAGRVSKATEEEDEGDARDCAVKGRGPKGDALANVGEHQVALDVALEGDLEHAAADVHADPVVALLGQDLAAEATPRANVEEVARAREVVVEGRGGEVEQFEAAVRHLCLD